MLILTQMNINSHLHPDGQFGWTNEHVHCLVEFSSSTPTTSIKTAHNNALISSTVERLLPLPIPTSTLSANKSRQWLLRWPNPPAKLQLLSSSMI